MNLHRTLLVSLALLTPAAAHAAIDLGDGDDSGGGGYVPPTTQPTFQKKYNKSDAWLTSGWGASYNVTGGVWATSGNALTNDRLGADGSVTAFVHLGYKRQLFAVVARGTTEANKKTIATLAAYVGGNAIRSWSFASTTSTYELMNEHPDPWMRTFVDDSISMSLGPIPVTFRARATGQLKAGITGKLSNAGIEVSGEASGDAGLYLSAAVGGKYCKWGACVGASAGVYANVELLKVAAPAKVAAWWSVTPFGGVMINHLEKADVTISALSGEAGVFADACLFGCLHEEATLVDWDGFTKSYALINSSGSYCLAGNCGLANPNP